MFHEPSPLFSDWRQAPGKPGANHNGKRRSFKFQSHLVGLKPTNSEQKVYLTFSNQLARQPRVGLILSIKSRLLPNVFDWTKD